MKMSTVDLRSTHIYLPREKGSGIVAPIHSNFSSTDYEQENPIIVAEWKIRLYWRQLFAKGLSVTLDWIETSAMTRFPTGRHSECQAAGLFAYFEIVISGLRSEL